MNEINTLRRVFMLQEPHLEGIRAIMLDLAALVPGEGNELYKIAHALRHHFEALENIKTEMLGEKS